MNEVTFFRSDDPELIGWIENRPAFDLVQAQHVLEVLNDPTLRVPARILSKEDFASVEVSDQVKTAVVRSSEFHATQLGVVTSDWEELDFGWGWRTTACENLPVEKVEETIQLGKFKIPVPDALKQPAEKTESGMIGQRLLPLTRVGVIASSAADVLMNVEPAKTAKVAQVVVAAASGLDESVSGEILAACRECGVDQVIEIEGAEAVAAFAFGVEGCDKVDKIVGGHGSEIAYAKRLVSHFVGVDQLSSGFEFAVVALPGVDPADTAQEVNALLKLVSGSRGLLVVFDEAHAEEIVSEYQINHELDAAALSGLAIVLCEDIDAAGKVVNAFAPGHVLIFGEGADQGVPYFPSAGSISVGSWTTTELTVALSGLSWNLPGAGSARWSSALSVQDFLRVQNLAMFNQSDFDFLSKSL